MDMKKRNNLLAVLTITSLLVGILIPMASRAQTRAPANPADLAFQKLQTLSGEWEGKDELGKAARTVFQSSISRTVMMETLSQTGFPPMMTLYSVDGSDIAIVHYCAANNRPRMKAVPGTGALKELVFSFIDAGNLPTPETGHEHKLIIRFDDDDHITETWTWHENGQDYVHVFQFSRKAGNPRNAPSKKHTRPG